MPEAPVVEVAGLRKQFGAVRALDGLDLVVERGKVHGFLGPNGAGKTTTIRVLLGLVRPDGGVARVLGVDAFGAESVHRRLAFVPGEVDLWGQLSGRETLDVLAGLRGGIDHEAEARLVSRFELDPSRKVAAYSKGNRQKVALVAALASGAELFLFDEPTDGLDPLMVQVFREEVAELRARGATVLLSSHVLSEVEELCDAVTIIRAGRAVEVGTMDQLRDLAKVHVAAQTVRPFGDLAALRSLEVTARTASTLECLVAHDELDGLVGLLHAAGLVRLDCRPPTLESIFLANFTDAATTA